MPEKLSQVYAVVQPLNRAPYSNHLNRRTTTILLRNPLILSNYIEKGFIFIRRLHYEYNHIMREPTNGCRVELSRYKEVGSIPIASDAAIKLITRVSYF
jgi:hypothetical protein